MSITGSRYVLTCRIHQRGEHLYTYEKGNAFITKIPGTKDLRLGDDAMSSVASAVERIEKLISEMHAEAGYAAETNASPVVFYRQRKHGSYDCIFEFNGENGRNILRYEDENPEMILRRAKIAGSGYDFEELISSPTNETINENPFYKAALSKNDEQFQLKLKAYYHLSSVKERSRLGKFMGVKTLPALPENYDKQYAVDADTISVRVLNASGYTILHRPYFAMNGSTHEKWTLNPHTMTGVDAAKCDDESIPFSEYLELFEK